MGKIILGPLTADTLARYRDYLLWEKRLSPSSIDRKLVSLRRFVHFLHSKGYIPENPLPEKRMDHPLPPLESFIPTPAKMEVVEKPQSSEDTSGHPFIHKLLHNRPQWYKKYHQLAISHYIHFGIFMILLVVLGIGMYDHFFRQTNLSGPYNPSILGTESQNRILSFSGRLSDSLGTPITIPTAVTFNLYNQKTDGTALYTTGVCTVSPNDQGFFTVAIGGDCGPPIPPSLFGQNPQLFLGITISGDSEMEPRQEIASVGYSFNSQLLQGYSPSTSAAAGQIPVISASGDLVLGTLNPRIYSTSGTFQLNGQSLSLVTDIGSSGDITIAPDGTGNLNLIFNGVGGNQINAVANNLGPGGTLYYGGVTNTSTSCLLMQLQSAGRGNGGIGGLEATSSGEVLGTQSAALVSSYILGTTNTSLLLNDQFVVDCAGNAGVSGKLQVSGKFDKTIAYSRIGNGQSVRGLNGPQDILISGRIEALNTAFFNNNVLVNGNVGIGTTSSLELLDLSGTNPRIHIGQGSAPASTTDRLYNVSGSLFWNGTNLTGGGALPSGATGQTLYNNAGSWTATYNFYNNGTNVGIGTTAPGFKLDVQDSQSTTPVTKITNLDSGTNADGLSIQLGFTGVGTSGTNGNRFVTFLNGNGTAQGAIESNGASGVTFNTTGADFAEYFIKEENTTFKSGELVCIGSEGKVTKCQRVILSEPQRVEGSGRDSSPSTSAQAQNDRILGIVSSHPGFIGGTAGPDKVLVGLLGQVNLLVSTENGPVEPGDMLNSSSIEGIAAKQTGSGMIVGKALNGFDPTQDESFPCPISRPEDDQPLADTISCGKITVFIHPGWSVQEDLNDTKQYTIVDVGKPSAPSFSLADATGKIVEKLGAFSHLLASAIDAGTIKTQQLIAESASIPALIANQVTAIKITTSNLFTSNIETDDITVSGKGKFAEVDVSLIKPIPDTGSVVVDLSTKTGTMSGAFIVKGANGQTSFDGNGDATLSGTLSAVTLNGHYLSSNEATISGTLYAEDIETRKGKISALLDRLASSSGQTIVYNNVYISPIPEPTATPIYTEIQPSSTPSITPIPSNPSDILNPNDWSLTDGTDPSPIASSSAVANITLHDELIATNGITVIGNTSLGHTTISGNLIAGGLSISNGSISSFLYPLKIQEVASFPIELMAGKIIISTNGDITIEGNLVAKGGVTTNEIRPLDSDISVNLSNKDGSTPSGQFIVEGKGAERVTSIDPAGNLTTQGDIKASSAAFSGQLEAQHLTIDGLSVKNATEAGVIIASAQVASQSGIISSGIQTNATTGRAVLARGESNLIIFTPYVKEQSLVYLTPLSPTDNKVLYIAGKKPGSFIHIAIDGTVDHDIVFNWWIIN